MDAAMRAAARRWLAAAVLLVGCDGVTGSSRAEDFRIERESLYNRIVVERRGNEVDLQFRLGRAAIQRQTAVDLTDPLRLVIPYTETMLAAALVQPQPKRVLQIGMGGGALNRFLTAAYPDVFVQSVEIDREVVNVARKYMGYEPSERDVVAVMDGRMFVKRNPAKWDWIYLDAFRDGVVPVHLKTKEFLELLAGSLEVGGVLAVNLHPGTALYRSDLATLAAVFPRVELFQTRGAGNVVALAHFGAALTKPPVVPEGVPAVVGAVLEDVAGEFTGPVEPSDAQVLTDDYAPAEFLQSRE